MNKPARNFPRRLSELVAKPLGDVFARQGFASAALLTNWPDIVGREISALAEPQKLQWGRVPDGEASEPATLVLRVEGPGAIEVQHLTPVILERVNRFLGWRAVARITLRQAPLSRRPAKPPRQPISPEQAEDIAAGLTQIDDSELRAALGRLGAAVKQS